MEEEREEEGEGEAMAEEAGVRGVLRRLKLFQTAEALATALLRRFEAVVREEKDEGEEAAEEKAGEHRSPPASVPSPVSLFPFFS